MSTRRVACFLLNEENRIFLGLRYVCGGVLRDTLFQASSNRYFVWHAEQGTVGLPRLHSAGRGVRRELYPRVTTLMCVMCLLAGMFYHSPLAVLGAFYATRII
ncbi:unnamed protein product [Ectocarpus sp. 12 AP-2014]